jgi:hypothetical protein
MNLRKGYFIILLFTSTFALFGQNISDFEYEITGTGSSRTITITGYNGSVRDIRIPERINNIPVTIIGRGAFINKGLTGVVIPDTTIKIEGNAFELNNLTKVLLPANIQSIGDGAFSNNRLTEIFISPSVTFVGRGAFLANPLQRIIIGQNVTLEVGWMPDLPDIWEQFAIHYNNSGRQSGIYNTR